MRTLVRTRHQFRSPNPSVPAKSSLPSQNKSSKNNRLYFTKSVRSRLEKCSSCGSLLCVENSSASRPGEVVLFPHNLESSPAIPARLCAFLREQNISELGLPFTVSCFRLPRPL